MRQITYISILLLTLVSSLSFAQVQIGRQVIGTTGGFYQGANTTYSYTVGEAFVLTLSSGNIFLTQGFQQPQISVSGLVAPNSKPQPCSGAENGAFLQITNVLGCPGPYQITNVVSVSDSSLVLTDINLGAGDYYVTISGANGCLLTDILTIDLKSDEDCTLKFYSGITPNGDGRNDYWIIDNIEQFPENTVQIFNRWGNEIWSGEGYDNDAVVWGGDNVGSDSGGGLTDGTYFYVVIVEGAPDSPFKGWVEVTR